MHLCIIESHCNAEDCFLRIAELLRSFKYYQSLCYKFYGAWYHHRLHKTMPFRLFAASYIFLDCLPNLHFSF